jgi:hypothetical protein
MEERLPTAEWRVLRTPPADGAWNMAVDEAILRRLAGGLHCRPCACTPGSLPACRWGCPAFR